MTWGYINWIRGELDPKPEKQNEATSGEQGGKKDAAGEKRKEETGTVDDKRED